MEPTRQSCPDENALLDFVNGNLSGEGRERLQQHVNGCDNCQELLGQMMALDSAVARVSATPTISDRNPLREVPPVTELGRGAVVGRYVVLDALGQGGMGRVLAAYDPELNRKVALKLLLARSRSSPSSEGRARLLREAQAMARLAHPNVSAVFDVGPFGDGIFIAMELVEGQDLRKWLEEKPRPWREVLGVLTEAGRGLAAAHAAGLVHRDVKPDNILVGKDGRVRVTDFGLAAVKGEDTGSVPLAEAPVELTPSALVTPLTRPGTIMGTPAYMAPEQHRGAPADARTDQFAFCVTLFEALYRGEFPFTREQRQEIARGGQPKPREAPKGSNVPSWVRAVVLRGLALAPEDRYPTLDALLRELGRDPRARSLRWTAAAAALLLVAGSAAAYRQLATREAQSCSASAQKLNGIWDAEAKRAVRSAFEATQQSYALDTWNAVERTIDAYAASWVRMDVAACEAVRRGKDTELPLLQRVCLSHRLVEIRALKDVLAQADAKLLPRALAAATSLTPLERCANADAVLSPLQQPQDDATRAKVEEIRDRLAEVRALRETGRFAAGLKAIAPLVEAARALRYPPLEAQVLHQLGDLQAAGSNAKEAEGTLKEAELIAEAGGDDVTAAESAISLLRTYYLLGQYGAAREWERRATAYVTRLGAGERAEKAKSNLYVQLGSLAGAEGKLDESVTQTKRALAIREKLYGPDHPNTTTVLFDLAAALEGAGHFDEAAEIARRILTLDERTLGPRHPYTLNALSLLGVTLVMQGKYEEARPLVERALSVRTVDLGPNHFRVGEACWALAEIHRSLGEYDEAAPLYRRAREIYAKALGAEHYIVAQLLGSEADMFREQGKYREAMDAAKQAMAVLTKTKQDQTDPMVPVLGVVGDVQREKGQLREALATYQRAAELREKILGPNNVVIAIPLTQIGQAYVDLRQFDKAIPPLKRAMQVREGKTYPREADADTRFALAQALWETKANREQALRLAREAAAAYASLPKRKKKDQAKVEAWLARAAAAK